MAIEKLWKSINKFRQFQNNCRKIFAFSETLDLSCINYLTPNDDRNVNFRAMFYRFVQRHQRYTHHKKQQHSSTERVKLSFSKNMNNVGRVRIPALWSYMPLSCKKNYVSSFSGKRSSKLWQVTVWYRTVEQQSSRGCEQRKILWLMLLISDIFKYK